MVNTLNGLVKNIISNLLIKKKRFPESKETQLILTLAEFLDHDMNGFLIINFKLPPLSSAHVVRTYKVS